MKKYKLNPSYTKFAPATRESIHKIRRAKKLFNEIHFLKNILINMPFGFFILNDKRQIVFSNEYIIKKLGYHSINEVLGYRFGEIVKCVNSDIEEGGCGTSEKCSVCGSVQAILESQKTQMLCIKESRILIKDQNKIEAYDFNVSSFPFKYFENDFFIVSIDDISSLKRKENMERIFYHDLLNKTGSISSLLSLLSNDKSFENDQKEIIKLMSKQIGALLEDIWFQRNLNNAEKNSLVLNKQLIKIKDFLNEAIDYFRHTVRTNNLKLMIKNNKTNISFISDPIILKRILINLIKNAIEASKPSQKVTVNSEISNNTIIFSVNNPNYIEKQKQLQIFQRYFSTKGKGRGIGLYSVKIFTEKYLKGSVSFTSSKTNGTTFIVKLPKKI